MEQYVRTAIFMEMLLINLITSHYCMKKKYTLLRVIIINCFFTVIVLALSLFIRNLLNLPYLRGDFVIAIGFLYFIPLKYLYKEKSGKIFTIMFFSFTHTMTVTFYSREIGLRINQSNQFLIALLIQTLIYMFTTSIIIRFVKRKFVYILQNIPNIMTKYLITLSMIQFLTLIVIYMYFTQTGISFVEILAYFMVMFSSVIGYQLIYFIVKNSKDISFLKNIAYKDTLTGIGNRYMLIYEAEKYINEDKPFSLTYMDLDNFKTVNDTYGHIKGDEYLKTFVKTIIKVIGDDGKLYRMSGDEFIVLSDKDSFDKELCSLSKKIYKTFNSKISFLGVCCGCSKYPNDGKNIDQLLKKADNRMYSNKRRKQMEHIIK